jgi:hypothetical protein
MSFFIRITGLYIFLSFSTMAFCYSKEGDAVSYNGQKVRGFYVHIVQVNLNSSIIKVTPAVVRGFSDSQGYYPARSFSSFIDYYNLRQLLTALFSIQLLINR